MKTNKDVMMTRREVIAAGATFAAALGTSSVVSARPAPGKSLAALKETLDAVADPFAGKLGYSLHHRGRNEAIDHLGDEPFPTASTIKVAIMCEVMHQVEAGTLHWLDDIPVQSGMDLRESGGPAYYFKDDATLPLAEWLDLMITLSDNTATINLRDRVGMANVNRWLADHGFVQTKLLNGLETDTLGLRPLQQVYGLGMTTPHEMGRLLEMIRDGRAGSAASCDRMLRLLTHQYWDDDIGSYIPPEIQIAHKTGAVDASRSDVAYIFSPSGEYVLTIYTKEQKDQRWVQDNGGDVAIRTLAQTVWHHYQTHDPWSPPPGAAALLPS
jgi:beta-lactamase class A